MDQAQLQFYPEMMGEQAARLARLSEQISRTVEGIAAIPAALRGRLGTETELQALETLLERGMESARRLQTLANVLDQAADIYAGAERTVELQVQALPGSIWTGGMTGTPAIIPEPAAGMMPDGPVQFGDLILDAWLIRLTLEEQR